MSDKDNSFKEFILDQLSSFDTVIARKMFGGYGLYQSRTFFGIIFKGRLYFKTNAQTRALYAEQGMKPFQPSSKQSLKNYYEVPADILEDFDQLRDWAEAAIRLGGKE
jgi:DNA transformation protein and related proteins